MCLIKSKYKKETIKSIKRMNSVLHTNFSYVLCVEEAEFLSKMPKGVEESNAYRLEHLANVLGLWHKGLLEDYLAHNKNGKNYERIKPLFEKFLANYVYELTKLKILDGYDSQFDYSVSQKKYTIPFSEYDYSIKNERIEDIKSAIDVIKSFDKMLNKRINVENDSYLVRFAKYDYFGPMTKIYGYKNVKRNVKNYDSSSSGSPYNLLVKSNFLFRYNRIIRKCDRKLEYKRKKYLNLTLNIERKRLDFELDRLKSGDERIDYYFDAFLYRLANDIEFLFLKRLGGIKKVSELINIHEKTSRNIEKQAIVVDVDRMVVMDHKDAKTQSVSKKGKALEIKSFDDMIIQTRFRKEQTELRREMEELKRK